MVKNRWEKWDPVWISAFTRVTVSDLCQMGVKSHFCRCLITKSVILRSGCWHLWFEMELSRAAARVNVPAVWLRNPSLTKTGRVINKSTNKHGIHQGDSYMDVPRSLPALLFSSCATLAPGRELIAQFWSLMFSGLVHDLPPPPPRPFFLLSIKKYL